MTRSRLTVGLALVLIVSFSATATAQAEDWWPIRKGPSASTGVYGTVEKVSTSRYRVTKNDTTVGRVVKKTSIKWNVIKGDKKVGVVKKATSTKFYFYNLSGKKVGRLSPSGSLWMIYKIVPVAGTSNYAFIILGNADKAYPGAPTLGAGRILLWR